MMRLGAKHSSETEVSTNKLFEEYNHDLYLGAKPA